MAYENLDIDYPNFCIGPQIGTFCTINLSNPATTMRIISNTGSTVLELTLSSNIVSSEIKLEYAGPRNLTSVIDGLTFFTLEKVSTTQCIIKRWETRLSFNELLLKEEVVKYNTSDVRYNALGFAVETYYRNMASDVAYTNYIDIDDDEYITTGTKLFLGPSTDGTNTGATESATVISISSVVGRKRLYLNKNLRYEYRGASPGFSGDPVTFSPFLYIASEDGYGGDPDKGSIIRLDINNWYVEGVDTAPIYKKISAFRWCPKVKALASVIGLNMLFILPHLSYYNWRSMFLNNVSRDKTTFFDVYDVVFNDYSVYKLQDRTTLRDDDGNYIDYSWSKYNYQEDSLLPYTNNVNTYIPENFLIGTPEQTRIYVKVRDQFNVVLGGVDVAFYIEEGDTASYFEPLSGLCTTDSNGEAYVDYLIHSNYDTGYQGHTLITTKARGGSVGSTGSENVWTSNNIINTLRFVVDYTEGDKVFSPNITTLGEVSGSVGLRDIPRKFKYNIGASFYYPDFNIICRSFFTTPGGNWGCQADGEFLPPSEVKTWLPRLYRGDEKHKDGPAGEMGSGYGFTNWPYPQDLEEGDLFIISNQIKQVVSFNSYKYLRSLLDFYVYENTLPVSPYTKLRQVTNSNDLQISQLKLSLHTYYVDGQPYDYLWTHSEVDQFVFIEDAIPKFWSSKNPPGTNIWLKLRPFLYSLSGSTFRMWVREYSYLGDTGYYEITDSITVEGYEISTDFWGLIVTYDPQQDFIHGSTIFVKIQVYDLDGNKISVEYWFNVVPDYKAPYLYNMSPDSLEINVAGDSNIYFEVHDEGSGIDVDSLEVLLNSVRVDSNYLTITEVSDRQINVTYDPPGGLQYNKEYRVGVKVKDTSESQNLLNDSYVFYTAESAGVFITDIVPGFCKKGMSLFQDVSAVLLADGNGIDRNSIKLQVLNKDTDPNIVPIIYRVE